MHRWQLKRSQAFSARDHIDFQSAARRFLIFRFHVGACLAHGRSPRKPMRARVDRFDGPMALRSMHGTCTRPPIGSQVNCLSY
jgi:hypothetical protein